MDGEILVALLVGLPAVAGGLCFLLKNKLAIRILVVLSAITLIGSSILLYQNNGFILETSKFIDDVVLILDFALLLYFLYIGWQKANLPIIGLSLTYVVPLAYYKYWHYNEEIKPTMLADQLSITMTIIIVVVGSIVCIYALRFMEDYSKRMESLSGRDRFVQKANQPRFFLFLLLLIGAANGIVFSNDLTWLAFFWELTTLCIYELVRYDGTVIAEDNALRALWMGIIGGAAFMGALWLSYQHLGIPSLHALIEAPTTTSILVIFALLAIAAFSKSAQLPFQNWLIGAMVSPTPVWLQIKEPAGIYLILRIAPRLVGTNLSYGIASIGLFTFVFTAVMALNQRASKSILAYSTIGNLGLMIFCASIATPLSYSAAIILLIFHSMSKGLLFMTVGIIENKLNSRNIADWQGLLTRLPFTTSVMIIGIVAMFLPIFGVLLGKWAAVGVVTLVPLLPALVMIIMLLVGSSASMLFWAKWLGNFVMSPAGEASSSEKDLSFTYKFTLLVFVTLNIAASIGSGYLIGNFVVPTMIKQFFWATPPDPQKYIAELGGFLIWQVWIAVGVIIVFGIIISKTMKGKLQPAYLSGENVEDNPIAFRTTADTVVDTSIAGMFFDPTISTSRWERWAIVASIGLIAIMFALAVL